MFAQGETEEAVKQWATEPEVALADADQCIRRISQEIASIDVANQEASTVQEQQRKLEFEKRLTEQRLKQEQEAAEEKRKLDFEYQQKLREVKQDPSSQATPPTPTPSSAKMPKLIISRFIGTPQDWVRFWGQYEAQIHKSTIDEVTKFSYLRSWLILKCESSLMACHLPVRAMPKH